MASNPGIAVDTDPKSKPQDETTPDSKISSQPTTTSTSDSKSLTLPSTSNNSQVGYPSFSKLLEGVMAASSTLLGKDASFKGQLRMSHQEALANVTAKAAQTQVQQPEAKSANSLIEPPPSEQLESSVPSPSAIVCEEKPSLQHKDNVQEGNNKKSSCPGSKPRDSSPCKPLAVELAKEKVDKQDWKQGNSCYSNEQADDIRRTPNSDGYGWRKYGQKQVKNSGSSRSYYRCTFYNCFAKKKVQHLDVSGKIVDVVYKGDHNHDPPQNLKASSRKRDAPSAAQVNDLSSSSVQKLGDPHTPTSTCRKEVQQEVPPLTRECGEIKLSTPASSPEEKDVGEESITRPDSTRRLKSEEPTLSAEAEHYKSSKSDEVSVKEFEVIPLKKRRIKESGQTCSESVYRTFKEPKVVVHASGDVASSSDGYRWRKYGQKMVKGNPNPRSYYRCSSAGCPVRKHVERATDNSTAIIVTYEGIHDHDKPVPKKCHGSPKSPAHASYATATSTAVEKSEAKSPPPSQGPSAPQSRDVVNSDANGDKPGEAGTDKVLESARTLLSIGIELKSC